MVGNGWTQLDLLFDGAFRCAENGKFDTELQFRFKPDRTADFACMSNLTLCFSGKTCPVQLVGGGCPYTECLNWRG